MGAFPISPQRAPIAFDNEIPETSLNFLSHHPNLLPTFNLALHFNDQEKKTSLAALFHFFLYSLGLFFFSFWVLFLMRWRDLGEAEISSLPRELRVAVRDSFLFLRIV